MTEEVELMFLELYEEIKHGDLKHQLWLRDKILEFIKKKQK